MLLAEEEEGQGGRGAVDLWLHARTMGHLMCTKVINKIPAADATRVSSLKLGTRGRREE